MNGYKSFDFCGGTEEDRENSKKECLQKIKDFINQFDGCEITVGDRIVTIELLSIIS